MIITNVIIKRSNIACPNGKVYSVEVLQEIAKQIQEKTIVGGIGYPTEIEIALDKVSHTISNARVEDGCLVVDIFVIRTPVGNQLKTILSTSNVDWGINMLSAEVDPHEYKMPLDVVSISAIPRY